MSVCFLFNEHFSCFDFRVIMNNTTVNTTEIFGPCAFFIAVG